MMRGGCRWWRGAARGYPRVSLHPLRAEEGIMGQRVDLLLIYMYCDCFKCWGLLNK